MPRRSMGATTYYLAGQTVERSVGFFNAPTDDPVESVSFFSVPTSDLGPNPTDATLVGTATSANASGWWSVNVDTTEYDPATIWAVANLESGGTSVWRGAAGGLVADAPAAVALFWGSASEYTPGTDGH